VKATRLSQLTIEELLMSNYGYYLPLHPNTFETVRFLGIEPKNEGLGDNVGQKKDKNGTPVWVVSALVKMTGGTQDLETFTLTAPSDIANKIKAIEELSMVRLAGLHGGKWSKAITDQTTWSFQISGLEIIKAQ
jgi:hypothetical protein